MRKIKGIARIKRGKPFYEFLDERIFKPLGMASTPRIGDHDIIPNRAAGYQIENDELKNQDWVSPTFNSTADGTLYFNVLDMAKWANRARKGREYNVHDETHRPANGETKAGKSELGPVCITARSGSAN